MSSKKFGKSRLLTNENNPIRELDAFPYAHRLESGNRHFLDIQEDFTGLGNAFAVLGAPWKPHKSNVLTILPFRNTHEKFPTPKINIFSRSKKKSGKKCWKTISRKFFEKSEKCPKFFEKSKFSTKNMKIGKIDKSKIFDKKSISILFVRTFRFSVVFFTFRGTFRLPNAFWHDYKIVFEISAQIDLRGYHFPRF